MRVSSVVPRRRWLEAVGALLNVLFVDAALDAVNGVVKEAGCKVDDGALWTALKGDLVREGMSTDKLQHMVGVVSFVLSQTNACAEWQPPPFINNKWKFFYWLFFGPIFRVKLVQKGTHPLGGTDKQLFGV